MLSETGTLAPSPGAVKDKELSMYMMSKIPKSITETKSHLSERAQIAYNEEYTMSRNERQASRPISVEDFSEMAGERKAGLNLHGSRLGFKTLEQVLEEEEEEADKIFTVQTRQEGFFRGAPIRFKCECKLERDQWVGSLVQVFN
jgi:hypothetical protein